MPFRDLLPMVHPDDIVFDGTCRSSPSEIKAAVTALKSADEDLLLRSYQPVYLSDVCVRCDKRKMSFCVCLFF